MFNEFMITCVTYFVMNFTDWVGERAVRITYGWVLNSLVFFIIAFNSSFILYFGLNSIKLLFVKIKRRLTKWISKTCESIKESFKAAQKEEASNLSLHKKSLSKASSQNSSISIEKEVELTEEQKMMKKLLAMQVRKS